MERKESHVIIRNYQLEMELKVKGRDKCLIMYEEDRINLTLFSTVVTSNICMFLSCRPTTKGLQDRNIHILDGTTVKNKGKLILTEIFPSVQKHDI